MQRRLMFRLLFLLAPLIAIAGCSSNSAPGSPSPTPSSPSGSTVAIVPNASIMTTTAFNPNPITVASGTTVTWVNDDTITHTSTSDTNLWSSGNILPGGSFSFTFGSAGTYQYHCSIHPNMVATVTVQ